MKVPKNIENIIWKLVTNGEKAYVIGGAVRDYLSNLTISDYDIVTSASPEIIKGLFPQAVTAGNSFLVSFVDGIEVATYRIDKEDSAIRAFHLKEDVIRRDFTINGIAYDIVNDTILDYVGGQNDTINKILRFIGNPEKRIKEDPVRILRGIRFSAKYNLTIEKETFFSMFKNRELLKDIPGERIQYEIKKAFSMNNSHRFLTLLNEMEMLKYVFPSIDDLRGIEGGGYHNELVMTHCFNAVKAIEDKHWKLKLAALYHDVGKCNPEINEKGYNTFKGHNEIGLDYVSKDLKSYLKFPNELVDYVKCLVLNHMNFIDGAKSIRKTYSKLLAKNVSLKDFIYLKYADSKGNVKTDTDFKFYKHLYREFLNEINKKVPFTIKSLDIDGRDIMDICGIPEGKEIGKILKSVFEEVISDKLPNNKDDIIRWIKSCLI